MKDPSLKTNYDTTPATLGDLEIWGNRLLEMMDEKTEELKVELKAEIRKSADELRAEFNRRTDTQDQRLGRIEDDVTEIRLLLKSIDKKLSDK